jgi:tetratricopeptide (TPR) repeat protein
MKMLSATFVRRTATWLVRALLLVCFAPAAFAQREPAFHALQSDPFAAARAESAAHRFENAIELYRQILAARPQSPDALGEIADALESSGRWPEALPYLEQLHSQRPDDARRVFQLGRMKSWGNETRAEGAVLLKRASELDPQNPEILAGYAEVLSWSTATRAEAEPLFERALAIDPHNEAVLVPYASMLSWSGPTRPRAAKLFEQALAQDPHSVRALVGRGQLESWTGHPTAATTDFDAALQLDPSNAAGLRGKAEILNWQGQHREARDLLDRALAANPAMRRDDPPTLVELARANAGLGRYHDALVLLDQVPATGFPEAAEVRGDVTRSQAVYTELGFNLRHNSGGLNPYRLEALVSTPLGSANRLTALYRPTLGESSNLPVPERDFNSNYFALILDSRLSERLATTAELGGELYPGAPSEIDGAFEARYALRPSLRLVAGFRRQTVDDTALSARGESFNGVFLGQVRSNLADAGLQYTNFAHGYDASFGFSGGVYTGHNLDSNRRWGASGSIGKTLHGDRPYLHIAYNVFYLSFAHDANFFPIGGVPTRIAGGYFSPTAFLANSGAVRIGYHWARIFEWYADGSVGVQNVETTFTRFGNAQLASTFGTGFIWRPNRHEEFRGAYEYLDIFNAFQRHIVRIAWRHYF